MNIERTHLLTYNFFRILYHLNTRRFFFSTNIRSFEVNKKSINICIYILKEKSLKYLTLKIYYFFYITIIYYV